MAGLLGAEEIAGAADLKVAHGELEAGAELLELLDGAQAPLGVGGDRAVAGQEEVGVGLVTVAPHPAAELVELRKAEAVGVVDEDRVDRRDVDTVLDDRGREQDVGLAREEGAHVIGELALPHLPVRDGDPRLGYHTAQARGDRVMDIDAVVDEVDRAAAR